MSVDDVIYAVLLLISLLIGPILQKCGAAKAICSAVVGFVMCLIVCGQDTLHSIVTVTGFIFIASVIPHRYVHYVCFIWSFGYLTFFRTCHYFGYAKVCAPANIVQLVLTLRLVGLSFEMADTWEVENKLQLASTGESERKNLRLVQQYKCISVSPVQMLLYSYCYVGLFTGPYYTFRTFHDFVMGHGKLKLVPEEPLLQHIQEALPFGVIYVILSHFYTIDYVRTPEFYDRQSIYRLFYMVIIFFTFRMRMYFAWKLSECVCMSAGLGAYPVESEPNKGCGPTNLIALHQCIQVHDGTNTELCTKTGVSHSNCISDKLIESDSHVVCNYNTINNISVWGCEFFITLRESLKAWNCSVQFWLVSFIYRRCRGPQSLRTVIVMLVSAYWHGIHPGYYLSFLIIPLGLYAEFCLAQLIQLCGSSLPAGSLSFLCWLLKMRILEYCAMGFLLLDWETTVAYWSSIGYCVHLILLSLICLYHISRVVLPGAAFSHYNQRVSK